MATYTLDEVVKGGKNTYTLEEVTGGKPNKGLSLSNVPENAKNLLGGGVRGAGSIGSTLLTAGEFTPQGVIRRLVKGDKSNPMEADRARRNAMDEGLRMMGVDTDSGHFTAGKIGTEIAGTSGVGGLLAEGIAKYPLIANSLRSGGLSLGGTTGNRALDVGTRALGGGVTGGVTAGVIDPEYAGTGALIGAGLPIGVMASGYTGKAVSKGLEKGSKRLMQSALKPTIEQLRTGKAATAIDTLLAEGINPTMGGVRDIKSRIYGINDQIDDAIRNASGSVDKGAVLSKLDDVNKRAINQVSPTADLNAIQAIADDFINHPLYQGNNIPLQAAQELKKGTYKTLSKAYGQMKGAEIEAQKSLARGLKDEIARNVPEISALNARESALIDTLNVAERRALMEANKNIGGLALLANNPIGFAAFMADKSALFKSLAARMINQASKGVKPVGNLSNINFIGNQPTNSLGNFVQENGLLGIPYATTTNR
jgi:hypothetical protein